MADSNLLALDVTPPNIGPTIQTLVGIQDTKSAIALRNVQTQSDALALQMRQKALSDIAGGMDPADAYAKNGDAGSYQQTIGAYATADANHRQQIDFAADYAGRLVQGYDQQVAGGVDPVQAGNNLLDQELKAGNITQAEHDQYYAAGVKPGTPEYADAKAKQSALIAQGRGMALAPADYNQIVQSTQPGTPPTTPGQYMSQQYGAGGASAVGDLSAESGGASAPAAAPSSNALNSGSAPGTNVLSAPAAAAAPAAPAAPVNAGLSAPSAQPSAAAPAALAAPTAPAPSLAPPSANNALGTSPPSVLTPPAAAPGTPTPAPTAAQPSAATPAAPLAGVPRDPHGNPIIVPPGLRSGAGSPASPAVASTAPSGASATGAVAPAAPPTVPTASGKPVPVPTPAPAAAATSTSPLGIDPAVAGRQAAAAANASNPAPKPGFSTPLSVAQLTNIKAATDTNNAMINPKDTDSVAGKAAAAADLQGSLELSRTEINQLDFAHPNDWLTTGPGDGFRVGFAASLNDLFVNVLHQPPPFDVGNVADALAASKTNTNLGYQLARTLGTREAAQVIQGAIAVNPGLYLSPQGNRIVLSSMMAAQQRLVDEGKFVQNYVQTANNGNPTNGPSAVDAFNTAFPPQDYAMTAFLRALPSQVPGQKPDAAGAVSHLLTGGASLAPAFDQQFGTPGLGEWVLKHAVAARAAAADPI